VSAPLDRPPAVAQETREAVHSYDPAEQTLDADEVLERVHARLSDPERWHGDGSTRRGDFGCGGGLDAEGQQVPSCDPSAVRHCVIGAVKVEAGIAEGVWPLTGPAGEAFNRIGAAAGWEPGSCWNDRDGYDAVLAAVEGALSAHP